METKDRVYIDCREHPGAEDCGLVISGSEKEVMETAVQHAVSRHGEKDTPEFRAELQKMMKKEGMRKAG